MPGWRQREIIERVALVGTAILALGRVAAAEPESVRIDYMAPAGCPDGTAFLRSLRERTTRWRDATPDEQARRFLVRVAVVGRFFSGRLEIRSPDGSNAVRRVDGTTCDEVSSALTLMTALAIDPNALTSGPKAALESPAELTPKPAAEADRQRLSPSAVAVAARSPSASHNASQPWRWSAGLLGNVTFGLAPALGYGADLFVDAEAPASSTLGPAVRMGIFLNQCDAEFPTAAARFQWAAVAVEGCPVRLGLMDLRFTVHPCLAFRLGVLRGEGRRISQPNQTLSVWSDAGPVLRLRLAVTARLILEAQGALVLPLHRPTFEITDMGVPTTVYSVPRVGGSAGIGLAYRFR
jgi:hypothetical protein